MGSRGGGGGAGEAGTIEGWPGRGGGGARLRAREGRAAPRCVEPDIESVNRAGAQGCQALAILSRVRLRFPNSSSACAGSSSTRASCASRPHRRLAGGAGRRRRGGGGCRRLPARRRAGLSRRDRMVLTALRAALVGLLLFCLCRPALVSTPRCRSRTSSACSSTTRAACASPTGRHAAQRRYVQEAFGAADRALLTGARRAFQGAHVPVLRGLAAAPTGGRPDVHRRATPGWRARSTGAPGAGGGAARRPGAGDRRRRHQRQARSSESLLALKAAGVPVFTVGVGRETLDARHPVGRVTAPRAVLEGHVADGRRGGHQPGYAGQAVTLDVPTSGRIVGTQKVTLPADGEPATVRVRFTRARPGRACSASACRRSPGELVTENNAREALDRGARPPREDPLLRGRAALRAEVHPPRAWPTTRTCSWSSCSAPPRTSSCASSVDDADELVGGFPKTREELFRYRGLILGSIEASFFTADQLRMIAEFVTRRGGGLLMLGGPRSFARAATPAPRSPTRCRSCSTHDARPKPQRRRGSTVQPTRAGAATRVTQIAATEEASAARWDRSCRSVTTRQPHRRGQAGRDRAAHRHRRARARAAGARLPALRPRQGARASRRRTPGSGRCTPRSPSRT